MEQRRRLEAQTYYHHHLHRSDAIFLLHRSGDFLLRKTTTTGRTAVSVCWHDHILHFPIRKMADGYCFESQMFPSIDQLIEWHRKNKVPVTRATSAILKEPKPIAAWELLTHQLIPVRKLRPGHFGDLYAGQIGLRDGTVHPAAIKTMSSAARSGGGQATESQMDEVLKEARILRDLGDHPHLVKCYGISIDTGGWQVLTAWELVSGGRLDERLRNTPSLTPKKKALVTTAAAKALLHVHSHGYVHRNVCAKNFLVELDKQQDVTAVKLSGFHFTERVGSKGSFTGKASSPMPEAAWSSPESLSAYLWTSKSDVWSWAVTVWEIYTNGSRPYQEDVSLEASSNTNAVLQALRRGAHLRPHADMDETMLNLWRACLDEEPDRRPAVTPLLRQLNAL